MNTNQKISSLDVADYLRLLVDSHPLRAPVVRAAVRAFAPAAGSRGLDVGYGAGHAALVLAEAVGPAGYVTGVDIEPTFLAHARALADEAGLAARIAFHAGDMLRLPFDDDGFDWAWSMDSIGHHPTGDSRAIDELVRVVRPGGAVALLLHASDASEDGRKKLDQAWRVGREAEGSGERGLELPLDRNALSVALGRDNVVHLALADDAAAARVLKPLTRLMHYLGHDLPAADGRASARAE